MPPISASRSAPLMSCSSPAARNASVHVRKSCFDGVGAFFGARLAPRMSATLMGNSSLVDAVYLVARMERSDIPVLRRGYTLGRTTALQAMSAPREGGAPPLALAGHTFRRDIPGFRCAQSGLRLTTCGA